MSIPEGPEDVTTAPQPYSESSDHVPDPTAVSGTLETSGTGGGWHSRLEGVAAIFTPAWTVEKDGLAEHTGDLVQGDTTGIPAPAPGEIPVEVPTKETKETEETEETEPETEPETEEVVTTVGTTEDPVVAETEKTEDQSAKVAAGRRPAKKTASAPDTTKK